MKTPCKNPNGLQNMATIVDSKTRKAVKFNCFIVGFVILVPRWLIAQQH